jgi:DNA helicase-2/ATP-dependent DNA helicase PcrA
LHAALRVQRERVLADVRLIGGRLGELRLDTDRDIATGVVRYLELVKLAALAERPREQTLSEALGEVNARLLGAVTPLERELFAASDLDESLTTVQPGRDISPAGSDGEDPRLAALLPRRGEGILLSASDIETYRACPLRYKYARVLRIPSDPTPQQRFGIMVHKVLERYHAGLDSGTAKTSDEPTAAGARPLSVLMGLLDSGWRRAGFGATDGEVALLAKAREALTTYHQQLADQPGEPVWFERQFSFAVGPHVVRGRVDRVDRLPDGDYELIDYKTGYPKAQAELETDIQLSLYALAAERAWNVRATRQAYYYVLDNRKVSLTDSGAASRRQLITDAIGEVGAGVAAMRLDPTPSFAACSHCDYLNICPAAEA